jgi:beta-mannosidase
LTKQSTSLNRDWTVRLVDGPAPPGQADRLKETVPATVPGCVHADLLDAGLIPDPYLDRNELDVAWVGRSGWRYDRELPAVPEGFERTDLVFEGLDTVATVVLDGRELGSTRNMHRTYRFDVTGMVGPGSELSVRFASAYSEAEAVRELLGPRPSAYPEPFNFVRKMACSFGWDWGPTLVTAGIWRPVRLESWNTARFAQVRPLVTVSPDGDGRLEAHLSVERTEAGLDAELHATVTIAGVRTQVAVPPGRSEATAVAAVPEPRTWWPLGQGDQPLYDCEIVLTDASGTVLDTWTRRIGFRNVELHSVPDAHGTSFTLKVNGRAVFARGVNWIPDDALPARITPRRYRHRLQQAADAGVNLVRVWGGGLYEDAAFYDICDELGLMVWQDFPFACAAYPEEQPLRGEVDAEARENVVRLAPHPSLVLWNGNNENLWGFRDWDWEEPLAGSSWGEGYYLGMLPRIVAELDPTRPYTAGSPWSGSWRRHPNDPAHGTSHFWEVWNRLDHAAYLTEVPRFAAEFGWQAPAAYATIREALPDEDLAPDSPGMLHHQKAEDGNGKLGRGLAHHYAAPETFDAWHYLTQVNQARAIATGIAHWRSHWPVCAGTVVWQLNDCWPVTSWAAIDGAGRPKPLYFELRRLYADRLLSLQRRDGVLLVAVDNQSAEPWESSVSVRRMASGGTVLAEAGIPFKAAPREVVLLPLDDGVAHFDDRTHELIVVDAEGLRDVLLGCEDRDFAFPAPDIALDLVERDGALDVVITAGSFLRDLLLQADRLGPQAVADRGLITLLPGETATIAVTGLAAASDGAAPVSPEAVGSALFCVNSVQPARNPTRM